MYNPSPFRVQDTSRIVDFIRSQNFGIIFAGTNASMQASSVPMVVDDGCTILKGHLARANNMWQNFDGKEVLVVFTGPNHYISPVWYEKEGTVPTWNYVSVQIKGIGRVLQNRDEQMHVLDELVEFHEKRISQEWVPDWSNDHYTTMLKAIVAFEISVKATEGKWKLSQTLPKENRVNAARYLRKLGNNSADTIAELMEGS